MSKAGTVFYNGILAGRLERTGDEYLFSYDPLYLADRTLPPLALCFPKHTKTFRSPVLFPFFYGLLAEGANMALQCASLAIDENDHFTRLLKTAGTDTIGAVTVMEEQ